MIWKHFLTVCSVKLMHVDHEVNDICEMLAGCRKAFSCYIKCYFDLSSSSMASACSSLLFSSYIESK